MIVVSFMDAECECPYDGGKVVYHESAGRWRVPVLAFHWLIAPDPVDELPVQAAEAQGTTMSLVINLMSGSPCRTESANRELFLVG